MPPKERTTNFKTFEAQQRLLAALVASLGDNPRLDYKTIAENYGGDTTASALEHRFRVIKAQADAIREAKRRGMDPGSIDICSIRKKEKIHTLFGASTPDGLQFQFRSIKSGAKALTNAVANGEDPKVAFEKHLAGSADAAGSVPATPTHRTPSSTKRARSAKTTVSGSDTTPGSKRRKAVIKPEPEIDNDEDSTELDYDELDTTPTKPRYRPSAIQLVPREAWQKPSPGIPVQRSSFYKKPMTTTPSSALSAAPSGYTNQPAVSGNLSPFTGVTIAAPPVASSPISGTSTVRRDPGMSAGTGSTHPGSSDPTPTTSVTMSFATTKPTITSTSTIQQSPGNNTGMNKNNNPSSFTIFDAPSPSTIVSEDNDLRIPPATNIMTAPPPATKGSATAPSAPVKIENSFTAPSASPYAHFGNNGYGYTAHTGINTSHTFSFDHLEVQAASQMDFGSLDEEFGYEDAGDC